MSISDIMRAAEGCCADRPGETQFDPTGAAGAHEWFARALREQEAPDRPLTWPDRPDVYWCAGLAGGCDTWHRMDLAYVDVVAEDMPLKVCAPTVQARRTP